MPEFILNVRNHREFERLDEFTRGYITAAFFTQYSDLAFDDLSDGTLGTIRRECEAFQKECSGALEQACAYDYTREKAGMDFWFTRNRHGTGFVDRNELDGLHECWLDGLMDGARAAGEAEWYVGDDGKVYQMGAE
jgi:hypothetical protein